MARVFLARDLRLERTVVVKVLTPELADGFSAERFERELRVTARLLHPNIVPVLSAGSSGGLSYYTMPFIRGESLRARLVAGPVELRSALRLLGDVAHALAFAHGEGVLHRDIKPDNVLVADGIAVVTDFGIAKAISAAVAADPTRASRPALSVADGRDLRSPALTQTGMSLGTPAYMAPEQVAGEPDIDARADLYAWGVMAYECLAGGHPFGTRTAQGYIAAHLVESPLPLMQRNQAVPPSVDALIMRCLEKNRDQRPESARTIVDTLEGAFGGSDRAPHASSPASEPPSASAARDHPSIAVLPFVNLSADPENEYFSEGIAEEIRNLLAHDPAVRVAARSASFGFKGKTIDPRAIAEQLQVRTLLEGTVRRDGNRVRISAQLVNAVDGYQLWSDRFEHEMTGIFAVQDRIAMAIATTLRRALSEASAAPTPPLETMPRTMVRFSRVRVPEKPPIPRPHKPVIPEAYDEVLKGRYLNHRRNSDADIRTAMTHFRRALELEPTFGAALAGLAESYLWLCIFFVLPPTEAFAHVRRYAHEALAADHILVDPVYLLGEIAFWHDWDVKECERYVRNGLAVDPNSPDTLMLAARLHLVLGRRAEMLEAMDAAVRADPVGYGTRWYYLVMLYLAGAFDRASAEADRMLAEAPDYHDARRWRGKARYLMGDVAGGLEDLEAAASAAAPHAWSLGELSIALSANGRREEAVRIRDELVERSERRWIPPTAIVLAEVALGNHDAALRWCERAFQTRDFLCVMLPFEGMFRVPLPGQTASIDEDPRWRELVQRVGMGADGASVAGNRIAR